MTAIEQVELFVIFPSFGSLTAHPCATAHFSLFISMDGVYAENRLERFQCIFHCLFKRPSPAPANHSMQQSVPIYLANVHPDLIVSS